MQRLLDTVRDTTLAMPSSRQRRLIATTKSTAAFDCLSLALRHSDFWESKALSSKAQLSENQNDEGSAVGLLRDRIRDAFDILIHGKLIALVDKSAVRFTCSKFLCLALNNHYQGEFPKLDSQSSTHQMTPPASMESGVAHAKVGRKSASFYGGSEATSPDSVLHLEMSRPSPLRSASMPEVPTGSSDKTDATDRSERAPPHTSSWVHTAFLLLGDIVGTGVLRMRPLSPSTACRAGWAAPSRATAWRGSASSRRDVLISTTPTSRPIPISTNVNLSQV